MAPSLTASRSQTADGILIAALCQQSRLALDALGLPATFAFADLHERVQRHRDREIQLIPRRLPALAPHGLWLAGEYADYIFYDCSASQIRQHLIIGHEYGHLIFNDGATQADLLELGSMLTVGVDVGALMARTGYQRFAERRAEVFATVVVQRAESWLARAVPGADRVVAHRIAAALGGDQAR